MIRPGDQPIPGYRVEERLGSGQYGEVWRATSPGGTTVALKFLDMTGRAGWKEFRAIQRVKQIRHAHLMPIVALWLLDDQGQVLSDDAVEQLAGENQDAARTLSAETLAAHRPPARMVIATLLGDGSLRDRLDEAIQQGESGIPVQELLGYLEEAAKGIDYLNTGRHEWGGSQVGVQHCDVKPDNILLTGGSAVVCDFGVAQVLAEGEHDNRATSLSGSPAYMPPESFHGRTSVASDQYSLAVTYYELRTNQLPIDEASFAAAYEAHQAGKLDFSAVPPAEQTVLRQATDPDPSARYRSASEMVAGLRAAVEGAEVAAARPATRWYAAAGLAILLAAAGALWLAGSRQKPLAETSTVEATLTFNAPDISVLVNGKKYVVDRNGQLVMTTQESMPLVIEFAGDDQRRAMQWTVPGEQVTGPSRHEFALTYTAQFLARQAEELLASGDRKLARQIYAGAVEQAPEDYARLPAPQVVTSSGLLWPECLQTTPAGDVVVTGHRDGVVRRWSLGPEGIDPKPVELSRHNDHPVVDLAQIGEHAVSVDEAGAVRWSRNGASQELIAADGLPRAVAATGDGTWLMVATTDGFQTRVAAWPIAALDSAAASTEIGVQPGEFPRLVPTAGPTIAMATIDERAELWHWSAEPPSHKPLGGQQNEILTLAASRKGDVIAYAGLPGDGDGDEAALVVVATGHRYPLAGQQADSILATALDPRGELLATAQRISEFDPTGRVILWRIDSQLQAVVVQTTLEFDKTLGDVAAAAIAPSGGWIAAGHETGGVSIWQLDTTVGAQKTPVLTFSEGDRLVAVEITADGRWLLAGGRDGRIIALDLARLEMVLAACRQLGIPPRSSMDRST